MASSSRSRVVSRRSSQNRGDRDALDQLHDEVGTARVGGAGVEDLGDVGVVHQGQGLAFGPEPGQDLAAVHAGLDELQRDRPPHRLGLLGHVDRAHAPLADRLEQLVRADDRAGDLGRRGRAHRGGGRGGRRFEEAPGLKVGVDQPLDATTQFLVRAASAGDERGPFLARGDLDRAAEDGIEAGVVVGHG